MKFLICEDYRFTFTTQNVCAVVLANNRLWFLGYHQGYVFGVGDISDIFNGKIQIVPFIAVLLVIAYNKKQLAKRKYKEA
tara:strand:- start:101 stop:340 length:240 start_codon:yes stop_codon:yes gene_type:complete